MCLVYLIYLIYPIHLIYLSCPTHPFRSTYLIHRLFVLFVLNIQYMHLYIYIYPISIHFSYLSYLSYLSFYCSLLWREHPQNQPSLSFICVVQLLTVWYFFAVPGRFQTGGIAPFLGYKHQKKNQNKYLINKIVKQNRITILPILPWSCQNPFSVDPKHKQLVLAFGRWSTHIWTLYGFSVHVYKSSYILKYEPENIRKMSWKKNLFLSLKPWECSAPVLRSWNAIAVALIWSHPSTNIKRWTHKSCCIILYWSQIHLQSMNWFLLSSKYTWFCWL